MTFLTWGRHRSLGSCCTCRWWSGALGWGCWAWLRARPWCRWRSGWRRRTCSCRGRGPAPPRRWRRRKTRRKTFYSFCFAFSFFWWLKQKFSTSFFCFLFKFRFFGSYFGEWGDGETKPAAKNKREYFIRFFFYKICIGTKVLRKCEKQIIRKEQLFLKLNTEGK